MNNFCTRCGSPLNEDGTCPNCDTVYGIEGIFDEPEIPDATYDTDKSDFAYDDNDIEYGQSTASEYDYFNNDYDYDKQPEPDDSYDDDNAEQNRSEQSQQEQPSYQGKLDKIVDSVKDWMNCAASFFKKEPFDAVDNVLNGRTYLWIIFVGLNVIFGAFCIAGMFGNGFVWLLEKVFGSYAMLVSFYKEYTFGNIFVLFLFSLFTVLLLFCVAVGCEYALFSSSGKRTGIEKLARIVAISFFPMTIACAAAYIFSFFLIRVAGMIVFAGAIVSFRLLNEVAKREVGEMPFWNVALCNIAQAVAAVIIVCITLAVI